MLLAAMLGGPLPPVAAHIGGSIAHLFGHLKPKMDARYQNGRDSLYTYVDNDTPTTLTPWTKGFTALTHPATGYYCLTPAPGS